MVSCEVVMIIIVIANTIEVGILLSIRKYWYEPYSDHKKLLDDVIWISRVIQPFVCSLMTVILYEFFFILKRVET